jgi:hypothetical protein
MKYISCIEKHTKAKEVFDPGNKVHIKTFRHFMEHGRWPDYVCPFFLEWPYLTIPDMIKDKFARYTLGLYKNVD